MVRKEIKEEQVKEVLENLFKDKWSGKKVCIDRTLKTQRDKTYLDLVEVKQIKENLEKDIKADDEKISSQKNVLNDEEIKKMDAVVAQVDLKFLKNLKVVK